MNKSLNANLVLTGANSLQTQIFFSP